MDLYINACVVVGLIISIKNTNALHQPAPPAFYIKPDITLNGQRLTVADKFIYLGSTLFCHVNIGGGGDLQNCQSQRSFWQTGTKNFGALGLHVSIHNAESL